MSDQPWDRLKLNGNLWPTLARAVTWLLQITVLGAIFWVKSNYVGKEEYQKDSKETLSTLIQIGKDMQKLSDKMDAYDRLSKRDDDMEARIRDLEKQSWQKHP